jgi:hypothetical protein
MVTSWQRKLHWVSHMRLVLVAYFDDLDAETYEDKGLEDIRDLLLPMARHPRDYSLLCSIEKQKNEQLRMCERTK